MITETRSRIVARPAHDRNLAWRDGLHGDTEGYGKVDVLRITTTDTRRGNDFAIGALLNSEEVEEVLFSLDTDEAETLVKSLTVALVQSLRVHEGVRL